MSSEIIKSNIYKIKALVRQIEKENDGLVTCTLEEFKIEEEETKALKRRIKELEDGYDFSDRMVLVQDPQKLKKMQGLIEKAKKMFENIDTDFKTGMEYSSIGKDSIFHINIMKWLETYE